MIATALPAVGFGNKLPLLFHDSCIDRESGLALLANLNSFVLDYTARQKMGGQTLNFFIVEQLPVLPPQAYSGKWHGVPLADFIEQRVLELC